MRGASTGVVALDLKDKALFGGVKEDFQSWRNLARLAM